MIIVEWSKPGIWIDGLEREDAWRISNQIRSLEDAVLEANVSLNIFNQSAESHQPIESAELEFETRRNISREVEAELFPNGMMPMKMAGEDFTTEYDKRSALVESEVRHRMWQRGFLPKTLLHKPPFIFAKAFIHALDLFDKFLEDIAKDPSAPKGIKTIHENYCKAIPDLRGVRNSIQHAEDRSKGEHRGKKIDLKKVDTSKISIEGVALVNLGLSGNRFGTTMANGDYGAVDVSVQTIDIMRNALLDVYAAFEWRGREQLFPS